MDGHVRVVVTIGNVLCHRTPSRCAAVGRPFLFSSTALCAPSREIDGLLAVRELPGHLVS